MIFRNNKRVMEIFNQNISICETQMSKYKTEPFHEQTIMSYMIENNIINKNEIKLFDTFLFNFWGHYVLHLAGQSNEFREKIFSYIHNRLVNNKQYNESEFTYLINGISDWWSGKGNLKNILKEIK